MILKTTDTIHQEDTVAAANTGTVAGSKAEADNGKISAAGGDADNGIKTAAEVDADNGIMNGTGSLEHLTLVTYT